MTKKIWAKLLSKKVNSTRCPSPRDRNMQRGVGLSPRLCSCLKAVPPSCSSPLTSTTLRCSNCSFSFESTVILSHLCGRSACGFWSCSRLIIYTRLCCVRVSTRLQSMQNASLKRKYCSHSFFQRFKPAEMKKRTAEERPNTWQLHQGTSHPWTLQKVQSRVVVHATDSLTKRREEQGEADVLLKSVFTLIQVMRSAEVRAPKQSESKFLNTNTAISSWVWCPATTGLSV